MDSVDSDKDSSSFGDKTEAEEEDFFDEDTPPPPARYEEDINLRNMDADAIKVIRRLNRSGHTAYLVGGGVRDLLLDKTPKDFDVATSARPEEVRRLFRNCRVIGRRFRLAHILFAGGKIIETATFRRDPGQSFEIIEGEVEVGYEHEEPPLILVPSPKDRGDDVDLLIRHDNVFGEPHEDAIRRDFTINGLFYDLENDEVIDYVGGVPDLKRQLIKTIGDPDIRLREDPIRILRAIKFSARLDLGIDPELYDAIVAHRTDLERAARPRVLEEILRLLRGGAAHRSMWLTWDTGVMAVILPELAVWLDDDADGSIEFWRRLDAIDRRTYEDNRPSDAVLLSALLVGPIVEYLEDAVDSSSAFEDFFEEMALRLNFPRRLKDRIRSIVTAQGRLTKGKLGSLPRRDFFADAAIHFAIECEAHGEEIPEWAIDPDVAEASDEPRRPRRRRRRRR
ncbi:MAG: polynucleotide adenylyltransferase PcnB [Deltaproteobacteria bacterium]|nr:MAG: polynucleotide adenylyltransferase PcnB [Deltaproteobacteria bacterium]